MSKSKSGKPSIFKKIGRFFKDVLGEIKKIHWPSVKQLRNNTAVVIAMMVIVGVFVWLIDIGMGQITKLMLSI